MRQTDESIQAVFETLALPCLKGYEVEFVWRYTIVKVASDVLSGTGRGLTFPAFFFLLCLFLTIVKKPA